LAVFFSHEPRRSSRKPSLSSTYSPITGSKTFVSFLLQHKNLSKKKNLEIASDPTKIEYTAIHLKTKLFDILLVKLGLPHLLRTASHMLNENEEYEIDDNAKQKVIKEGIAYRININKDGLEAESTYFL
jgi:hypothetical protein